MATKQKDIHSFINETLEAITGALTIKESDRVMSICSCGAQPLSFLQYIGNSGNILAVDYNPEQIKFTKRVMKLIKECRIDELEALNIAPKDMGYFSDSERLEAIARNFGRLQFEVMDVSKKPKVQGRFNKGYFSNAPVNLKYFHPVFEDGALVYVAFATSSLPNQIERFLDNRSKAYGCDIKQLYDIDKELTERACKIETAHSTVYHHSIANGSIGCDWTPCVFRKK
jgi:hypothetical protein